MRRDVYNCPMTQRAIRIKKIDGGLLRVVDEREGTFMSQKLQIVDDSGMDTEKRWQLLLRVRD